MKRLLFIFCLISLAMPTYANWFQDIINAIKEQAGITNGLLGKLTSDENGVLKINKSIEDLKKELEGNYGFGTYQFHDYQSYGEDAKDWSQLLNMAASGRGNGDFGSTLNGIAKQFPIENKAFNKGISNSKEQSYYALKSQSVLAVRAASERDYNKIQEQIAYQQILQQQIENTTNLKAAVDLGNRLQVEGNLINLEILRQIALGNQQQAITEQAAVNAALSNAKFLTKP